MLNDTGDNYNEMLTESMQRQLSVAGIENVIVNTKVDGNVVPISIKKKILIFHKFSVIRHNNLVSQGYIILYAPSKSMVDNGLILLMVKESLDLLNA